MLSGGVSDICLVIRVWYRNFLFVHVEKDTLCWWRWLPVSICTTKYGPTEPKSVQPCCGGQKDKGACNQTGSGSPSTHFHDELDS